MFGPYPRVTGVERAVQTPRRRIRPRRRRARLAARGGPGTGRGRRTHRAASSGLAAADAAGAPAAPRQGGEPAAYDAPPQRPVGLPAGARPTHGRVRWLRAHDRDPVVARRIGGPPTAHTQHTTAASGRPSCVRGWVLLEARHPGAPP